MGNSPGKTEFASGGAAESGAFEPDLRFLIDAWEHLDEPVTAADPSVDLPAGAMELDLTTVPEMADLDGTYSFGVTAIDDSGLESTILQIGTTEVDHVPPDPPVAAHIVD